MENREAFTDNRRNLSLRNLPMPDIFVIDDKHPEDLAMLQALYSRSPASVVTHLEKLKASGSGKFMDQYYVGYGHASIGDCASTTLFIEQVSMLVAKAVQDNPLYNGQEASTRYLDFSKQSVVDPYNSPASQKIQTRWMEIYNRTLPLLTEGLKKRYPFNPAEYKNEKIWQNTLAARAFDISAFASAYRNNHAFKLDDFAARRARSSAPPEASSSARSARCRAQDFLGIAQEISAQLSIPTISTMTESPHDTYAAQFATRNNFVSVDDMLRQFAPTPDEIEADQRRQYRLALHNR